MSKAPCQPSSFDEWLDSYVVCAAAISQELAMQLTSRRADRPKKVGPGGGPMLAAIARTISRCSWGTCGP